MSAPVQRDWIVEASDRLVIGSDEAVGSIVARLPVTPLLRVADIAAALNISASQVHNWIDSGKFKVLSMGVGGVRQHRRIVRVSFISFLKGSIV